MPHGMSRTGHVHAHTRPDDPTSPPGHPLRTPTPDLHPWISTPDPHPGPHPDPAPRITGPIPHPGSPARNPHPGIPTPGPHLERSPRAPLQTHGGRGRPGALGEPRDCPRRVRHRGPAGPVRPAGPACTARPRQVLALAAADTAAESGLDELRHGTDEELVRTSVTPWANGLYYAAYERTYKGSPGRRRRRRGRPHRLRGRGPRGHRRQGPRDPARHHHRQGPRHRGSSPPHAGSSPPSSPRAPPN